MAYDLSEHRHRFAVWAAARAAQRGFTTIKNLRNALESTNIRGVLAEPETLQCSAKQFDTLHRQWCSDICADLRNRQVSQATYGRAAKLVAVYLKATVITGASWDTPFASSAHPPIDRILLQTLASSNRVASPHKAGWRAISWTKLDMTAYDELIGQLRAVVPAGAPFWMLEEFWEPSELESDTP